MPRRLTTILIGALLTATVVSAGDPMCSATIRECDKQIRQLLAGRRYLGATIEDRDPGLFVAHVVEKGPAARAGLRVGDRLVSMNRKPLTASSTREFKQILAEARDTGKLMIIVWRSGRYVRIFANLEPYTKEQLDKMIAAHVSQSHTSTEGAH
jgi:predicted metalloprotease with PDZ domain